MNGLRARVRDRSERGAVAILVAVLSVVLFMSAALAVDISSQVKEKHELQNQLDSAAVAAGYFLQGKTTGCDPGQPSKSCLALAVANAQDYYQRNYGEALDLHNIDFWCVVARRQTTTTPATPTSPAQAALFQIATTSYGAGVCNPDAVSGDATCASGKTCFRLPNYANRNRTWDNTKFTMSCSDTICAIPCGLQAGPGNNWMPGTSSLNNQGIICNTVRVSSSKGVPFSFAAAGGIPSGSTGTQISVACRGSCGAIATNPMDVVVVADRTPSMAVPDRNEMVAGIKTMLGVMTPAQQFVSIGAIGRSKTTSRSTAACGSGGLTAPSTSKDTGQWVPLKFYDDYLSSSGALNTNSNVIKALNCIDSDDSGAGTALAAPMKAAARYVLGIEGNNVVSELDGNSRVGEIRKVIIFETDGQPYENGSTNSDATSLSSSTDPMSRTDRYYTSGQANSASTDTDTNVAPTQLGVSPAPTSTYSNGSPSTTYNKRYDQKLTTTDRRYTYVSNGGQQACKNLQAVSTAAKTAGALIITIGYNLDSSTWCGGQNDPPDEVSTMTYNSHYISNIAPTTSTGTASTWTNTQRDACRSGSGTQASPYVFKPTTCKKHVRITYTSTATLTGNVTVMDTAGDQGVTDVLASSAGGTDVPTSDSNGCMTDTARAEENGDGDFFFCAASGDDMGPIFQTALSQVSTGVKLLSGLP